MQDSHLLARVLFAGVARGRLDFDRRGGIDGDLGVAERLHDRMTRRLVAFVTFLGRLSADFGDKVVRLRTASGRNYGERKDAGSRE
jgi:hypothetical protein